MRRRISILAALVLLGLAAFVAITKAEGPSGVTPTLLARGHFRSFNVRSDPRGTIDDFRAHSTAPIDILVRQHDYASHSTTDVVTADTANNAFVDEGSGHVVRNETDAPAQDISVITAPVGGAFRTNLPAPNPYCGF